MSSKGRLAGAAGLAAVCLATAGCGLMDAAADQVLLMSAEAFAEPTATPPAPVDRADGAPSIDSKLEPSSAEAAGGPDTTTGGDAVVGDTGMAEPPPGAGGAGSIDGERSQSGEGGQTGEGGRSGEGARTGGAGVAGAASDPDRGRPNVPPLQAMHTSAHPCEHPYQPLGLGSEWLYRLHLGSGSIYVLRQVVDTGHDWVVMRVTQSGTGAVLDSRIACGQLGHAVESAALAVDAPTELAVTADGADWLTPDALHVGAEWRWGLETAMSSESGDHWERVEAVRHLEAPMRLWTEAGTFDAIPLLTSVVFARESSHGDPERFHLDGTEWYVPGVGLVRSDLDLSSRSTDDPLVNRMAPLSTSVAMLGSLELLSYRVTGFDPDGGTYTNLALEASPSDRFMTHLAEAAPVPGTSLILP